MAEHAHHHHHHEEDCCCEACSGIRVAFHEGALIGTLTGHIQADNVDEAKGLLASAMTSLAARINEAGGVIGHIKAIVSEEGRGWQISVTDEEAVERQLLPSAIRADCTVIVFSVAEDMLRMYMHETIGVLIIPDEDDNCDDACDDDCTHEHHHGHHHN